MTEKFYPSGGSLPVSWSSAGAPPIAHSESPIIVPGAEEMDAIQLEGKTCGGCKYFSRAEGQRLMEAQRFVECLVREQKWQVHHLCSPLNHLGICGAAVSGSRGEEHHITGMLHKGCDQFRPANGRVGAG